MKILVWGTGVIAARCTYDLICPDNIIGYVESVKKREKFMGKPVYSGGALVNIEYDLLIIANSFEEDIFRDFEIDAGKTICYRNYKEKLKPYMFRHTALVAARDYMPTVAVRVDGLDFLFPSGDKVLADKMMAENRIWEKEAMQFMYENAKQINEKAYFLEIGAHVGMQSIYLHKRFGSSLKCVAFEPMRENYKYLRMNCIMNRCEEIILENKAVSDRDGILAMFSYPENSAGSSAMYKTEESIQEDVPCVTLDSYIESHEVDPNRLTMMWIDVEGHEPQAIHGMKKTLAASPVILYMEFNPSIYIKYGSYDMFMDDLIDSFSLFICWEEYRKGRHEWRPIEDIKSLAEDSCFRQRNIFLKK